MSSQQLLYAISDEPGALGSDWAVGGRRAVDRIVEAGLGSEVDQHWPTCIVYNTCVETLPRIKIAGDLDGDYVVLEERPDGRLRIAPEQTDRLPRIVRLERTTWAYPTQWVATLADGRTVYARSRHGEFSVGVGNDLDEAVLKSSGAEALYFEYVEDSPLGFDELRAHLYRLLEFPAELSIEGAELGPLG